MFLAVRVLDQVHAKWKLLFINQLKYLLIKILCLNQQNVFLLRQLSSILL